MIRLRETDLAPFEQNRPSHSRTDNCAREAPGLKTKCVTNHSFVALNTTTVSVMYTLSAERDSTTIDC